jgi:hypothetical protein
MKEIKGGKKKKTSAQVTQNTKKDYKKSTTHKAVCVCVRTFLGFETGD